MSLLSALFLFLLNHLPAEISAPVQQHTESITIELEKAPLDLCLRSILRPSGKNLVIDSRIAGMATLELDNQHWRSALKTLCKKHHLDFFESQTLIIVTIKKSAGILLDTKTREYLRQLEKEHEGPYISLKLDRAPLDLVLNSILSAVKKNVILDPQITGIVSIQVKNIPWKLALEAILRVNGYRAIPVNELLVLTSLQKSHKLFTKEFLKAAQSRLNSRKTPKISLRLDRVTIKAAIQKIAESLNADISFENVIERRVSINLKNVDASLALDAILRVNGLQREQEGNRWFVRGISGQY